MSKVCQFESWYPCGFNLHPGADYDKAKGLTDEASTLASRILDARLQLTRLRQARPHPRLTVASANARLDSQVSEMQELDDELQNLNEIIDEVKEKVKDGAKTRWKTEGWSACMTGTSNWELLLLVLIFYEQVHGITCLTSLITLAQNFPFCIRE